MRKILHTTETPSQALGLMLGEDKGFSREKVAAIVNDVVTFEVIPKAAFTRQTKVGKLVLANLSWCVWTAQKQSANTLANCCWQIECVCRLFCAVHTHQLEFANTSLPTLVCRVKAALKKTTLPWLKNYASVNSSSFLHYKLSESSFGSCDAPWSEWSWITDVLSLKILQNLCSCILIIFRKAYDFKWIKTLLHGEFTQLVSNKLMKISFTFVMKTNLSMCCSRHDLQNLWPHFVCTGSLKGKWQIKQWKSSSTGFTKSSSKPEAMRKPHYFKEIGWTPGSLTNMWQETLRIPLFPPNVIQQGTGTSFQIHWPNTGILLIRLARSAREIWIDQSEFSRREKF